MDIKLTDFCSSELQTLLNALASHTVDLKNRIDIQKEYNIDLGLDYEGELMTTQLWVVQVINAKVEVTARELIQSN